MHIYIYNISIDSFYIVEIHITLYIHLVTPFSISKLALNVFNISSVFEVSGLQLDVSQYSVTHINLSSMAQSAIFAICFQLFFFVVFRQTFQRQFRDYHLAMLNYPSV